MTISSNDLTQAQLDAQYQLLVQQSVAMGSAGVQPVADSAVVAHVSASLVATAHMLSVATAPAPAPTPSTDNFPYDPDSPAYDYNITIPYNADGSINETKLQQELDDAIAQLSSQPGNLNAYVGLFNLMTNIGGVWSQLSPSMQSQVNAVMNQPTGNGSGQTMGEMMVDSIAYSAYFQGGAGGTGAAAAQAVLTQMLSQLNAVKGSGIGWITDALNEANVLNSPANPGSSQTVLQQWMDINSMNGDGQTPAWSIGGVKMAMGPGDVFSYSDFLMLQMGSASAFVENSPVSSLYSDLVSQQISAIMSKDPGMRLILLLMFLNDRTNDKQAQLGNTGMVANSMSKLQTYLGSLINNFTAGNWTSGSNATNFMAQLNMVKQLADTNPAFAQIKGQIDSAVNFFNNLPDAQTGPTGQHTLLWDYQNNPAALQAGLAQFVPNPNTATGEIFQQGVQNLGMLSQDATSQSSATLQLMNSQTTAISSINGALKSTLIDGYAAWNKYLCDHQLSN
jgi:hypothetical protein